MNFVFLSPAFPPNYYLFCARLREEGVNTLGIGEQSFGGLRPELRDSLAWYCQVENMRDRAQLSGAMRFLGERFGKLDRIDSLNEYWLETEAKLRTEFAVPGIQAEDVYKVRRKSLMKKVFALMGVPYPRGRLVSDAGQARALAAELGFPVVVKPDDGMGAEFTYRLDSPRDVDDFFAGKPDRDFIMEEFIGGGIVTFDGLAGPDGKIVFCTSHVYGQGVMEAVLADMHISYYSLREIPDDILDAGQKLVKGFNVKERFFHFEFFRRPGGRLCALEVNIRPPGGMTMDMFNYACDIDMYAVWAGMMARGAVRIEYSRKFHCGYAGRKNRLRYAHSHEDIMTHLGDMIVHHDFLPPVLARAMGDTGYLIRAAGIDEVENAVSFIQEFPPERRADLVCRKNKCFDCRL